MPINPLDLQTNFSQINTVGKQQTLQKETEVLKQEYVNTTIHKKSEKDSDDIPETKNLVNDSNIIKENENKKLPNKKNKLKKDNKKLKENTEETKKENEVDDSTPLKDPNLGKIIDILG